MIENNLVNAARSFRDQIAALISADPMELDDQPPGGPVSGTELLSPPAMSTHHADDESRSDCGDSFFPHALASLAELEIDENEIVALVLKCLLNSGVATGASIAAQIKLPLRLIGGLLRQLKQDCLVVYKGAASHCDFDYELTEAGRDRARRYAENCPYCGATPVSLAQYAASVAAQSVRRQTPTLADVRRAFADIMVNDEMLRKLGQAARSGWALFLYGSSGNGKTSIAERITRAFGESIWIPRAIGAAGEIIRLYDPTRHEVMPATDASGSVTQQRCDERWIRIRRPTIIVGGELTMENLEVTVNKVTGVSEAPVQLKSNCGTLVVDDFGRQRIATVDLLNRWIVPLEKHYDILNLGSGRRIDVPFDQVIVFATNLEPRQLVDDAFLRRIPYKIDVKDPSEAEFRELFRRAAQTSGMVCSEESISYLVERHYVQGGRAMRYCHPRDLMNQVRTYCAFLDQPLAVTVEAIDAAIENYFAVV
jgi:predicted ATPase with chaperone activity